MLITEKVSVTWNSRNKEHFQAKGYEYTGYKDQFFVNVSDLQKGSNILVEFTCDCCNGEKQTENKDKMRKYIYLLSRREKGKDYCDNTDCQRIKRISKLNINYKETNLALEHPHLMKEWDFSKNDTDPNKILSGTHVYAWWRCSTCNHEWKCQVKSRTVLKSGCPTCRESKGEKKISQILNTYDIKYKTQFEFKNLTGIGGGLLRFDYAIFDKKDEFVFLVEYDGEFHFKKVYQDDSHETIVEHDKRKNKYCIENNISLKRIPYWDFNEIDNIMVDELNKYSLIV